MFQGLGGGELEQHVAGGTAEYVSTLWRLGRVWPLALQSWSSGALSTRRPLLRWQNPLNVPMQELLQHVFGQCKIARIACGLAQVQEGVVSPKQDFVRAHLAVPLAAHELEELGRIALR
jgi:hypothetical protein